MFAAVAVVDAKTPHSWESAGLLSGRSWVQSPAGPTRRTRRTGEIMPAVIEDLILHVVKMFASYGSDVKLLALSSSSFLINWKGT